MTLAVPTILSSLVMVLYNLADTYFVAARLGADGLAALNIAIPGYSLVNATGLMVAMGGAVRYTIAPSQGQEKQAHEIFTKTMLTGCCLLYTFFIPKNSKSFWKNSKTWKKKTEPPVLSAAS